MKGAVLKRHLFYCVMINLIKLFNICFINNIHWPAFALHKQFAKIKSDNPQNDQLQTTEEGDCYNQ